MVRVGIVGLGGMGNMHFGIYEEMEDAEVVAIADTNEEKLKPGESSLEINIGEGGATIDPDKQKLYTDPAELMEDDDVDMVDICLPTFLHAENCIKALQADKHVLCEKPMAFNSEECQQILDALEESSGQLMVGHCIRFWPEYVYLKEAVESGRMGNLRELEMWRGGAMPDWSWEGWLTDHNRSGGAILDLHIHDVDFVHYLLGKPRSVSATGSTGPSGGYDAVRAFYRFDDSLTVSTGANMNLPEAFGFEMRFMAVFESGALIFNSRKSPGLLELTPSGEKHPDVPETDGYHEEIEYFLKCIENNEMPAIATPESSAHSIKLVEAEIESIESGESVKL